MLTYGDTWYLSVVPIVIAIIMNLACTKRMKQVLGLVRGTIKSPGDLAAVRGAINVSMRLAIVYILMYALMMVALIVFVLFRGMAVVSAAAHLMIFGAITLPVAPASKGVDKRMKSLKVAEGQRGLSDKYADYLAQWDEFRLSLSDD